MSREKEKSVLVAIGQIVDKMDFDDAENLRYILQTVKKSEDFARSGYGSRFINKISARLRKLTGEEKSDNSEDIKQLEKKTEDYFKDIDENLFQLASQRTTRSIQKLVWVILAFTITNTIGLFFLALFMWKLNMG